MPILSQHLVSLLCILTLQERTLIKIRYHHCYCGCGLLRCYCGAKHHLDQSYIFPDSKLEGVCLNLRKQWDRGTDYNRAPVSTLGLWHYPATITDTTTTWEVASFSPDAAGQFKTKTTGAVINNFGGRLQMVWFMGWATEWARTSNYLNH